MIKQFVIYDIALKLKQLGFDEKCLSYYTTTNPVTLDKNGNLTNFVLLSTKISGELVGVEYVNNSLFNYLKDNDITNGELFTLSNAVACPLHQQVLDWFRVKYNVLIIVYSNASGYLFEFSDAEGGTHRYDSGYSGTNDSGCWNTFEEARTASILMAIELNLTN